MFGDPLIRPSLVVGIESLYNPCNFPLLLLPTPGPRMHAARSPIVHPVRSTIGYINSCLTQN